MATDSKITVISENQDLRSQRALNAETLYGEDFSASEIKQWFADEQDGYFNLYFESPPSEAGREAEYTYAALAEQHGYSWLGPRRFENTLGIGSATGSELAPILNRSERLTVLEPSDGFAATHINGKPVTYVKPQASGLMPFADESFDLIVCFSVLHHIPNVSTVLREMHRVIRPGGKVLLREPTHSMGDWRKARHGLTKNERGIPLHLFRTMVLEAGFQTIKETRCIFSLTNRLEPAIGRSVWTVPWLVRADAWLCSLPIWRDHYHATRVWHKIRPTGVAFVLEKPTR